MNRLSTLIWLLAFVIAAFMLYMVKYQVQSVRQQVAQTSRELEQEKEALHVVAAEWAYLNRPDRLEALAQKYLSSSDLTVDQVADVQAIPFPQHSVAELNMPGAPESDIHPVAAHIVHRPTGAAR